MQKKIQVMLVDDEYLAIEDLKTLIDWNALGFEICATARSGRQALHAFESAPADLVITDISMPGMNGITLVEQLQQKNPRLLFLLLTAHLGARGAQMLAWLAILALLYAVVWLGRWIGW